MGFLPWGVWVAKVGIQRKVEVVLVFNAVVEDEEVGGQMFRRATHPLAHGCRLEVWQLRSYEEVYAAYGAKETALGRTRFLWRQKGIAFHLNQAFGFRLVVYGYSVRNHLSLRQMFLFLCSLPFGAEIQAIPFSPRTPEPFVDGVRTDPHRPLSFFHSPLG